MQKKEPLKLEEDIHLTVQYTTCKTKHDNSIIHYKKPMQETSCHIPVNLCQRLKFNMKATCLVSILFVVYFEYFPFDRNNKPGINMWLTPYRN